MKRLLLIAATVIASVLASLLLSGSQVSAQIPAGNYRIVIDCDGKYVGATSLTLTLNGSDVTTIPLSLQCSPSGQARQNFSAPSNWNDSRLQYWCDNTKPAAPPPPPPLNTLNILVPLQLDKWYLLLCPSTGITHDAEDGPPGQPRIQIDSNPVGGVAEVAGADASALGATDSGSSSGTTYAVIAVIAGIAGVALLGAGGWYARRRWLS